MPLAEWGVCVYMYLSLTQIVLVCVPDVIARYRDKIRKLEPEIHEIMKTEEEEKQVCGYGARGGGGGGAVWVWSSQEVKGCSHVCQSTSTQLRISEMEVNKACNMIEHQGEIFSRPPRTWIQRTAGTKRAAGTAMGGGGALGNTQNLWPIVRGRSHIPTHH